MGQCQSLTQDLIQYKYVKIEENLSNYDQIQVIQDKRFGQMNLLVNKTNQVKYAKISKTLNGDINYEKKIDELLFIAKLEHPNIIKLCNFHLQKEFKYISLFDQFYVYKLDLLYEYFNNNLKIEIRERQRIRATYRENEIWYLLDSLLNAVYYIKSKNLSHCDIRPYNVIINECGQIKLGQALFNSQPLSSYSQLQEHILDDIYISPQVYKFQKEYKLNPNFDTCKSDIYSVGMTILEAATLENVSYVCYDRENQIVRYKEINRLLDQVRNQYSYYLYSFLSKLLTEFESERASIEELNEELNQQFYKNQKSNSISTINPFSLQITNNNYIQEMQQIQTEQQRVYFLNISKYNQFYHSQKKQQELKINKIEQFETVKFNKKESQHLQQDVEKCSICLCEFLEKGNIHFLLCLHKFHEECINAWLEQKSTCPVCIRDQDTLIKDMNQLLNEF